MIQWKQRLYAFLLRRVLGPFLDSSAAQKLHDSLDVSLQEGVFVLKDVVLDAQYLTERLTDKVPGLCIRKAKIDRLEIRLTLRENQHHATTTITATSATTSTTTTNSTTRSSLAWRAMKLGTVNESLPAVSLVADVIIDGISLELEPIDRERRKPPKSTEESNPSRAKTVAANATEEEPSSKSVIGSYIDAALASLQLSLKVTNIAIKLYHSVNDDDHEVDKVKEQWVAVKLSMFSYSSLDVNTTTPTTAATQPGAANIPSYKMVVHKLLEFSAISIVSGESVKSGDESVAPPQSTAPSSTIALAEGNGQIFYRVIEYNATANNDHRRQSASPAKGPRQRQQQQQQLQQDIEIKLNHQLNLSVDHVSLSRLQALARGFSDISEANNGMHPAEVSAFAAQNSLRNNPHILGGGNETDLDRDDLKALTGIMRQYREAYHLAEHNQLRGGILVPSNAYLDDAHQVEEDEDSDSFDVFFDANDQSFYNATSVLARSIRQTPEDSDEDSEHVNTKLRFHLLSGCLKIVFRQPGQIHHSSIPQEYMLMTVEDVSLSLSSSHRTLEVTMTVLHFDIEDAQFTKQHKSMDVVSMGTSPVFESSVEIGRVLGFVPDNDDSNDIYGEDALLSHAPFFSFHWKRTKEGETCCITLLALELVFRHRTVSNLSQLKLLLQNGESEQAASVTRERTTAVFKDNHKRRMELSCTCPLLVLSVPLLSPVSTSPMFERSREVVSNATLTESSIGICFENTGIELMSRPDLDLEAGQSYLSGGFTCHQVNVFVMCPENEAVAVGARVLRKDILIASGRLEVNPFIPISFSFAKVIPYGKEMNPGRDSFPIVPAISSFKARQEDDDDDDFESKNGRIDIDSTKDLRGGDPQISMLADAEKSQVVVTVLVPEMLMNLSGQDLNTFFAMVDAAKPVKTAAITPARSQPCNRTSSSLDIASIAVVCESITLSVCEDNAVKSSNHEPEELFACILAMDRVRCHALLVGSSVRHFRVMTDDPCLYASFGPQNVVSINRPSASSRVQVLKNSIRNNMQKSAVPLLFRSRMFNPISHDTPSILLDVIDASEASTEESGLKQRRVYLTLYHLTYRYDAESTWIPRFSALLSDIKKDTIDSSGEMVLFKEEEDQPSMTRLFISCADMNLDYTSPICFERVSRSIVRIGDCRFSSNIMAPIGSVQAYKISMGDVNCHISNIRMPCHEENSRLCRSSWLVATRRDVRSHPTKSVFGAMPEAVLREMGFVNIVSLDMMEASATKRKGPVTGKRNNLTEPQLSTTLSMGTLSIHACKDSFNCFSEAVAELQAKLTALSDADITALKDCSSGETALDFKEAGRRRKPPVRHLGKEEQFLIPEIDVTQREKERETAFLLDGYEWTTIDHDPLKELEISPGDEQRAGWYSAEQNNSGILPVDIIHQHFPLHAIADPLSEGDMQARKFAGKGSDLCVKSRLLIHKLCIRIRFFDGYDWPDCCSENLREAAMRPGKMFVIEPVPPAVLREKEKKLSQDIDMEEKRLLSRKAQLMGELLDIEEETSTFVEAPLPQDRALTIDREKHVRLNSRRSNVFFQVSMNGMTLRMDSFDKSPTHRLQSVLELSVSNLFVAETVSISKPIKMFGEWTNDQEHPRDTRFGTVMLSMATWSPVSKVTKTDEVESDECEMTVQLLPMRLLLDQRAITFIRAFVNTDAVDGQKDATREKWSDGLHLIPPPRFKAFKIKPWKVKVDYHPTRMDVAALREGSIVELVNISPIHRMVITLSEVQVVDSLGLGPVFSDIVASWVKEICGTQLHKFLANARPFEPFTDVGQGLTDLVILPYEAFKQGDSIQRAMRKGMKSLAETVVFQTLTTSSGLTKYAADLMADILVGGRPNEASNPLPSRPIAVPKGIQDVRRHACESLARGIQTANYKVIVVPYREFTRSGVTGAVTSVIKGIPVLLVAPLTGATEAASYTLLGARNALRPDIRKEEEASMSLH